MEITERLLPQGTRPRRIAIGSDEMVYYTDFSRGYLGRLDPNRGKIEEWASPGGTESRPYGIAITPDGTVWYSESGVNPNTIVRFDPAVKSSRDGEYPLVVGWCETWYPHRKEIFT